MFLLVVPPDAPSLDDVSRTCGVTPVDDGYRAVKSVARPCGKHWQFHQHRGHQGLSIEALGVVPQLGLVDRLVWPVCVMSIAGGTRAHHYDGKQPVAGRVGLCRALDMEGYAILPNSHAGARSCCCKLVLFGSESHSFEVPTHHAWIDPQFPQPTVVH